MLKGRKRQLRAYSLAALVRQPPGHLLLALFIRIHGDFWRGAVNIALVGLSSAYALLRWLGQGDPIWWWLPIQLLIMPGLMAVEESLHARVALRKKMPVGGLQLVTVCRMHRGICWLCDGAALRICGRLSPLDRMHISAPGLFLNMVLAGLLWAVCACLDGRLLWGRAHWVSLPLAGYLFSSLVPLGPVMANDLVNIFRAAQEAGYGWIRTTRECWYGLVLAFGRSDARE
jgi:hypothetical protein